MPKRRRSIGDDGQRPSKRRHIDEELDSASLEEDRGFGDEPEEVEDTMTADERKLMLAQEVLAKMDDEGDIGDVLKDDMLMERSGRAYMFKKWAHLLVGKRFDVVKRRGHKMAVTNVCISADEQSIFSVSKDCCIVKWDIEGNRVGNIKGYRNDESKPGHTHHILTADITTDGKMLATAGRDGLIMLWDPSTCKFIDAFQGHHGPITSLRFRKGTHELYSGSEDTTVKSWNCDAMAYLDTFFGHQLPITDMDTLRRERAITTSADSTVRCWKIKIEKQLVFRGVSLAIDCVAMITDDSWITGSQTGALQLWTQNRKKPKEVIENAHGGKWISSVAALPYSDVVASGSSDGVIRLWKVNKSKPALECINEIPMEGWINDLRFSTTGKYLIAAVGKEQRLGRWDTAPKATNGIRIFKLQEDEIKQST